MFIYLFVFFLSALMFYFTSKIKNKTFKFILTTMAIMLPAVLAGCRASSVGTDVTTYGIKHFMNAANSDSYTYYFQNYSKNILSEPLYHMLVYILSKIFDNYHWALFFYEFITIIFAYLGIKRCNTIFNTPIWLGMLLYYLAMFNVSLNLMRQSIAVSIVFLAVTYLFESEYFKYVFFCCLAVGFHTSAIISIIFLPLFLILRQEKKVSFKKRVFQVSILLLLIVFVILFGSKIIKIIVSAGIIRSDYLNYLSSGLFKSNRISYVSILTYFIYVALYIIHYKFLKKDIFHNFKFQKHQRLFFLMISFFILFTMFGSLISTFISRLCFYFFPLQIVSMANILYCYSKKSKIIWIVTIVSYSLLVWFIVFVIKGDNATVPYVFDVSNNMY